MMIESLKNSLVFAFLSVVAAGVVLLAMFIWFRGGAPLVAAQDYTVGEMLLDEGLRLEAAGADEEAMEKFWLAEDSRFEGTKNLRHLQATLGLRLLREDEERAEGYLAAAVQDYALLEKEPGLWMNAWLAYVRGPEYATRLKEYMEAIKGADVMTRYRIDTGRAKSPYATHALERMQKVVEQRPEAPMDSETFWSLAVEIADNSNEAHQILMPVE